MRSFPIVPSTRSLAIAAIAFVAAAGSAAAQGPALTLPQPSPAAAASQRVGITDITITYHRPAVNKREVWGKLVPWNEVWRAGANENTVITFTSPVTVGGHAARGGSVRAAHDSNRPELDRHLQSRSQGLGQLLLRRSPRTRPA